MRWSAKGISLNAIALNSAAFNGARLIGPVFAGLAIAYMGLPSCFYLNAASFIPVIIAPLDAESKRRDTEHAGRVFERPCRRFLFYKETEEYPLHDNSHRCLQPFRNPFTSFLPVFAEEIFNAGPTGLGLLVSATGLGALSAALMLAFKVI